jgi:hypothetical protein
MPTLMITMKSSSPMRQRRAVLQRGEHRVAILRFIADAEKIDLSHGRYVLEWNIAGEPGAPYQVQVSRAGHPVASSHPSLRFDRDGIAAGAIAFEVG